MLLILIDKIYVRGPLSKIVVEDIYGKDCNERTYISIDWEYNIVLRHYVYVLKNNGKLLKKNGNQYACI